MTRQRLRAAAITIAAAASLSGTGCLETGYVLQAVEGQLDMMCRARGVDAVVDDEETDPRVRDLLLELPRIKSFAGTSGLVPTGNYESYVDLDRPAAVWVVSATPEFSFEPLTWTFPIVGSVPYLGWFDRYRADEHADDLRQAGYDVDLRGASAYSTLGWFADPVLSSMLEDGPSGVGELADTILHESVHATIYVPGQSSFNEGLATFVGKRLAVEYLEQRFGRGAPELAAYEDGIVQGKERKVRMVQAFGELERLYATKLPVEEKRARKRAILMRLARETRARRVPNNATLAGFRTYHGEKDDFGRLFTACGTMPRFLAAAKTTTVADFDAPQAKDLGKVIDKLVARACRP